MPALARAGKYRGMTVWVTGRGHLQGLREVLGEREGE